MNWYNFNILKILTSSEGVRARVRVRAREKKREKGVSSWAEDRSPTWMARNQLLESSHVATQSMH